MSKEEALVLMGAEELSSLATTEEGQTKEEALVLTSLLRIANEYRAEGALQQATELYFKIFHEHSDTPEAKQARRRLQEIAEFYEMARDRHQARALYERLL